MKPLDSIAKLKSVIVSSVTIMRDCMLSHRRHNISDRT